MTYGPRPPTDGVELDFKELIAAIRSRWWLLAVGAVVGGLAAMMVSFTAIPLYASTIQLFVSTTNSTTSAEVYQGSQFSQARVSSYARLFTGDELLGRVIQDLGLETTPQQLAGRVTATAVPDTVILDVTVTYPDAKSAFDIASSVGDQFSRMVSELETPTGAPASPVSVTVIDTPDLATSPSEPKPVRNVALGIAAGLLVGICGAGLRGAVDRSLRDGGGA